MPHGSLIVDPYELIPLCDGWAPLPLSEELPGVAVDWDAERQRFPWAFPADDRTSWAWHVHALLVRHPDGLVLIDTGIGHLGRPPYDVDGRLDAELAAVDVANEEVEHVVLTHLHSDHSGGACRRDGSPRFPNAHYHVHPEDWSFFETRRMPDEFTGRLAMDAIERAGLLDLDPADHEVGPGLHVEHAPGHTPGHRVVRVDADTGTLLLTGDLLHVPPQVDHPSTRSNHDEDPDLGARERTRLLAIAAAEGWSVGVSHFARPFGRVGPDGWSSV